MRYAYDREESDITDITATQRTGPGVLEQSGPMLHACRPVWTQTRTPLIDAYCIPFVMAVVARVPFG